MSPTKKQKNKSRSISSRIQTHWAGLTLAALILFGFGLRMVDLTDLPLDFHPTRQYRGALIARSIYYQLSPSPDSVVQEEALAQRFSVAELEPPILESIVAGGYWLSGGENLWVARIFTSLFWVLAAIPLYALALQFTGRGAALIAVAYFLFLAFGFQASRSFQPDPFMVTWLIFAIYSAYRWVSRREWKWALIAAIASAIAILIKVFAAYLLLGVLAALVLSAFGARAAVRNRQVWTVALIAILPAGLYYLLSIGGTSGNYFQNWIVALMPLAFQPEFYFRWADMLTELLGSARLVLVAAGVLIAPPVARWLLIGAWLGYAAYGITLPHQTTTHTYYHLMLVPIAALSMAPLFDVVIKKISQQSRAWQILFAGLLVGALAVTAWTNRSNLLGVDYRSEAPYWERVGAALPADGKTIGLVQHYGNLLNYYGWRRIELWPVTGELYLAGLRGNEPDDFEQFFLTRTADMDYFLITTFNQLDQQPLLQEYLAAHYPVFSQGDGYLIYDLRSGS